ncbi:MAG: PrsW family intramembrane metalloprotease [Anaerolineae bacterium]|nr:PrsW family intramembrane metalloprotease [Anaerolineae bacterium]
MDEIICCVCHKPVQDARQLGGRTYCELHFARVTQDRRSIWRTGLVQIIALLVFVLVVSGLVALFKPVWTGWQLTAAGIVLSLIPAIIWLAFFYQQDRLEPEPKGYVLSVFLLGALLAQAVGIPVVQDLFDVRSWLPLTPWTNILGSILVIGFTQEFLKYAAVRYSVYPLAEFDERVDGVIYATAAGLGYATMLNVHYVIAKGGVDLQVGVIRIVVTALAQASFAGLTGYFLGRAKFEDEPVWWLPSGIALAAVLNGLFTYLRGELTTTQLSLSGGGFNPWIGLILATIVAGATFGAVFYLIRLANRITLSGIDAGKTG